MNWYIAPLFVSPDHVGSGTGDPVEKVVLPGSCLQAHDESSGTCLVGMVEGSAEEIPADWEAKTLAEAQAHFTAVVGRAPGEKEVC